MIISVTPQQDKLIAIRHVDLMHGHRITVGMHPAFERELRIFKKGRANRICRIERDFSSIRGDMANYWWGR